MACLGELSPGAIEVTHPCSVFAPRQLAGTAEPFFLLFKLEPQLEPLKRQRRP